MTRKLVTFPQKNKFHFTDLLPLNPSHGRWKRKNRALERARSFERQVMRTISQIVCSSTEQTAFALTAFTV